MFRRIEMINHFKTYEGNAVDIKHGLMGTSPMEVIEAWIDKLRGPFTRRGLPRNCRFYFTELGWKEVGRKVVEACQKTGQEYKVIAIKETDANVVWRDKFTNYEVAIQPKRKRSKGKKEQED